jgi:hypothetical protein
MHRLLRLPWARRRYAKPKTQGERPFAEIKQAMRFRCCQLRGRAKVWGAALFRTLPDPALEA